MGEFIGSPDMTPQQFRDSINQLIRENNLKIKDLAKVMVMGSSTLESWLGRAGKSSKLPTASQIHRKIVRLIAALDEQGQLIVNPPLEIPTSSTSIKYEEITHAYIAGLKIKHKTLSVQYDAACDEMQETKKKLDALEDVVSQLGPEVIELSKLIEAVEKFHKEYKD